MPGSFFSPHESAREAVVWREQPAGLHNDPDIAVSTTATPAAHQTPFRWHFHNKKALLFLTARRGLTFHRTVYHYKVKSAGTLLRGQPPRHVASNTAANVFGIEFDAGPPSSHFNQVNLAPVSLEGSIDFI